MLRTGNNGTNETDGLFCQFIFFKARRRPATVWGIRQGAATMHGGKGRCFMFRNFQFVTLVLRFCNNQVLQEIDAVVEAIWSALHHGVIPHPHPNPPPEGEEVAPC